MIQNVKLNMVYGKKANVSKYTEEYITFCFTE